MDNVLIAEAGDLGVSLTFTVWAVVGWILTSIAILLISKLIREVQGLRNENDGLLGIMSAMAHDHGVELPATREALRDEMAARGWRR